MRAVSAQGGNEGILVGVGAGLAIVVLLVLESTTSGGFFGTGTEAVTATSISERLYDVTFYQGPACGTAYLTEWGVRLGNWTLTEPSNVALSEIPENGGISTSSFNLTSIVFSVPSGVYHFTVYPTSLRITTPDGSESTGIVTVTSSDVSIHTFSVEVC